MPNKRQVKTAGIVLLRQRPGTSNAGGRNGCANLVIRTAIWERFHRIARHSNAWLGPRPAGAVLGFR